VVGGGAADWCRGKLAEEGGTTQAGAIACTAMQVACNRRIGLEDVLMIPGVLCTRMQHLLIS